MTRSSFLLGTVRGIPIRVHVSLILPVAYWVRQHGLATGLAIEIGLLASIVLHELGHSLVALSMGCRVREITLLCVGGAAQMEQIPRRPLHEFLMAIAGPAVSLVLGISGILIGALCLWLPPIRSVRINVIEYLGWMNVVLMVFNLLPAFPMDGGRILRALLSLWLGRLKATAIAVSIGKLIAVLLGARAFFVVLRQCFAFRPFSFGGWIMLLIAFFVYLAADREYIAVRMQEAETG